MPAACSGDTFAAWLERAQTPERFQRPNRHRAEANDPSLTSGATAALSVVEKGGNTQASVPGSRGQGKRLHVVCPPSYTRPDSTVVVLPGETGRPLGRLFSMLLSLSSTEAPGIFQASRDVIHAVELGRQMHEQRHGRALLVLALLSATSKREAASHRSAEPALIGCFHRPQALALTH